MPVRADRPRRAVVWWLSGMSALALALVVAGVLYYHFQTGVFRAQAERRLASIAELKVDELSTWYRERLSDARFYQNNRALAQLVARYLAAPDDQAIAGELRAWFSDTQGSHNYGVFLTDAAGIVRLSLPANQPSIDDVLQGRVSRVLETGELRTADFYVGDAGDRAYLGVVMPLRTSGESARVQGTLVWRLDPASFVYPLLGRWPTPTTTAELLLVRREGDEVVFLYPGRSGSGGPLQRRESTGQGDVAAVRAALGTRGIVDGRDSQGVPVLAAAVAVPNTDWVLLAQESQAETFAPLRDRLWTTVAIVGALLLAAAATVGLLWRQQAAAHYRTLFLAEAELRAKAEAWRHADQLLRFHVENSPLAMIEWDRSFRVVNWSARAEAIFGWSAEEVIGKHPSEWSFVHPDDVATVDATMGEMLSGRVPRNASRNRNRTRDGRVLHCEWYNSILLDAAGGTSSVLSLAQDVSDRVRAEEGLRTLNIELEQRVAARTAQLEAKNRELEVFTYSVSHDLKAPLRAIEGYSRLLVDDHSDALDDEAQLFLANIRQAAANMGRLIDDLLAYSRLERRPSQRSSCSLPALVDGLLSERALEIAAREVVVTRRLPDEPIVVDTPSLSIALGNLIDNALKFSAASAPPTLEIGADTTDAGTHVWVRDNGVGFDMKYSERIFDIFQRLHRAEEYPGTGIGLAIVRKSMERLGGRARAEGRPGQGATFHLELPA